jgi:hypothetical protein
MPSSLGNASRELSARANSSQVALQKKKRQKQKQKGLWERLQKKAVKVRRAIQIFGYVVEQAGLEGFGEEDESESCDVQRERNDATVLEGEFVPGLGGVGDRLWSRAPEDGRQPSTLSVWPNFASLSTSAALSLPNWLEPGPDDVFI